MTQSFDDIKINNCTFKSYSNDYYAGFESGAQSKQAEIDELLKMVKKLIDNTVIGIDDDVENQARDLLKGTTNEQ